MSSLVGTAVFCSICKEFINIMLDILDFPYMYTNHIGCVTFSSIEILRILPLLPSLDPTPFSDSRACLELALWAFPKATAPNASGGLCPCHWRSKFSGKKAGEGCCSCCCYCCCCCCVWTAFSERSHMSVLLSSKVLRTVQSSKEVVVPWSFYFVKGHDVVL